MPEDFSLQELAQEFPDEANKAKKEFERKITDSYFEDPTKPAMDLFEIQREYLYLSKLIFESGDKLSPEQKEELKKEADELNNSYAEIISAISDYLVKKNIFPIEYFDRVDQEIEITCDDLQQNLLKAKVLNDLDNQSKLSDRALAYLDEKRSVAAYDQNLLEGLKLLRDKFK